jgi:hypothetical protein
LLCEFSRELNQLKLVAAALKAENATYAAFFWETPASWPSILGSRTGSLARTPTEDDTSIWTNYLLANILLMP